MRPSLQKISESSRQLVRTLERSCQVTIEESTSPLARLQGTMALGTLMLIEKMSLVMDRSMDLIESQLEESRLNKEVLTLRRELLERELREAGSSREPG